MERIVSKTKYSRKQHKQFYLFHLFHRTSSIYILSFLCVLLLILSVYNTMQKTSLIFSWMMFAITAILVPLLIIFRINDVIKRETPEKVKSSDKIEITKAKIESSNDTIKGKLVIGWYDVDCICENDQYFYIYTADTSGIFIPKSDIIEGDPKTFEKLALNNMKPDKKGKVNYKRYGQVKKQYKAEQKQLKRGLKK